jgi:hypothetical protein
VRVRVINLCCRCEVISSQLMDYEGLQEAREAGRLNITTSQLVEAAGGYQWPTTAANRVA